jgi:hypothetical protein
MTSRPVFERPRLMRTLLCLLIGVLALLWRAVPSFSWVPRDCYPEFHCHGPCPGDGFVWLCFAISGPNYVCGDEIRVQYWNGSEWRNMTRYSETYYFETCMRLRTCGACPGVGHCNLVCLKFATTINEWMHCHIRSGWYLFEPGVWNTQSMWQGSSITMYYCL